MKRSCEELGVCQVEGALAFDLPCPQPCGKCDLRVVPVVVDGSTVAVEVSRSIEPKYTGTFPFAPGVIDGYPPEPSLARQVAEAIGQLAAVLGVIGILAVVGGFLAGIARGKGWL